MTSLQAQSAQGWQALAGQITDLEARIVGGMHQLHATLAPGAAPAPVDAAVQAEIADLKAMLKQTNDILVFNHLPPAPPLHLQHRVVGCVSPDFIHSAERSVAEFRDALAQHGVSLDEMKTILDFGVGCGRVSRRVAESVPGAAVTGADIDPEAIAWLNAHHAPRLGQFVVLPHLPPTPLPVAYFDLVYSISVFTHLDEAMQFAWLAELQRVTKPGGWLLLTVHGENFIERFPQPIQDKFFAEGILYNEDSALTDGLPDFYKNTYHARAYVEREWARYFEILSYLPLGNENHQDLIVCRRRLSDKAA